MVMLVLQATLYIKATCVYMQVAFFVSSRRHAALPIHLAQYNINRTQYGNQIGDQYTFAQFGNNG